MPKLNEEDSVARLEQVAEQPQPFMYDFNFNSDSLTVVALVSEVLRLRERLEYVESQVDRHE